MKREYFKEAHRNARLGNLDTLACGGCPRDMYQWFLREVYDLRFPHIGNDTHKLNSVRTHDVLARKGKELFYYRQILGRRMRRSGDARPVEIYSI